MPSETNELSRRMDLGYSESGGRVRLGEAKKTTKWEVTKMKSFKIYTERLNESKIKELLSISFDGFTVIHTKGFWKGTEENSLIIEILTDNETLIRAVAQAIKLQNKQDAVLVTSQAVDCELI